MGSRYFNQLIASISSALLFQHVNKRKVVLSYGSFHSSYDQNELSMDNSNEQA
jgi:hypothetical protein